LKIGKDLFDVDYSSLDEWLNVIGDTGRFPDSFIFSSCKWSM